MSKKKRKRAGPADLMTPFEEQFLEWKDSVIGWITYQEHLGPEARQAAYLLLDWFRRLEIGPANRFGSAATDFEARGSMSMTWEKCEPPGGHPLARVDLLIDPEGVLHINYRGELRSLPSGRPDPLARKLIAEPGSAVFVEPKEAAWLILRFVRTMRRKDVAVPAQETQDPPF